MAVFFLTRHIPYRSWANEPKVDYTLMLDIYRLISFMNKGPTIVQKLYVRCGPLKVIWFGINSGAWADSYNIVDDIIILSNPRLYDICRV